MNDYENFNYHNSDILFILKEDKPVSYDKAIKDLWLDYQWFKTDENGNRIRDYEKTEIELGGWDDNFDFCEKEFYPLTTCKDRLEYAYACMHEDTFVDNVVAEMFPEVTKIYKPCDRRVSKYYLQYWMKKYNFTLYDFIFNDKYIILHDDTWSSTSDKLVNNGFIDWDKIEYCSECEEEE